MYLIDHVEPFCSLAVDEIEHPRMEGEKGGGELSGCKTAELEVMLNYASEM